MALQLFDVRGRHLGSRSVPNFRDVPGFGFLAERSYVYFCNRCGEVWGGLYVADAGYTSVIQKPCEKHGDGRLSLCFPADLPLGIAADWPKEALLRELKIEMELSK